MLAERAATVLNGFVGEHLQTATAVELGEIIPNLDRKLNSRSARSTMARITEEIYIF